MIPLSLNSEEVSVPSQELLQKIAEVSTLENAEVLPMQIPIITLTRKKLYDEIWTLSVAGVARKYGLHYAQALAQIKSAGIPIPPSGYWTKVSFGKPVEKTDLTGTPDDTVILTSASFIRQPVLPVAIKDVSSSPPECNKSESKIEMALNTSLAFLSAEEHGRILSVVKQIQLPDEKTRMHPTIVAHRKVISEWKKQNKAAQTDYWRPRNAPNPPILATDISDEAIPRACRIVDALIKALTPLGCTLTPQLKFTVNGESVGISFCESQDKVEHVLTKEEHRKLLEYEEERKRYKYASQPKFRKYDHIFNGRLSCSIDGQKNFRDCNSYRLEDRLGDMVIHIYIAAENCKQQRLAQEEAERQRKEEERRREEKRNRYHSEVKKTLALANIAEDYDMACKIRACIAAYKAAHPDDDITEWVLWANQKADWYDPTIARTDELLGDREHAKNKEDKEFKNTKYWWQTNDSWA